MAFSASRMVFLLSLFCMSAQMVRVFCSRWGGMGL